MTDDGREVDLRTAKAPSTEPSAASAPDPIIKTPSKKLSKAKQVDKAMEALNELEHPRRGVQTVINEAIAGQSKAIAADDKRKTMPHLFKKGDPRTRQMASKGGRAGKVPRFREVLEREMERRAEDFIRPFTEGLALREDPKWAPSTKLDFFINQSILAEKAFDRIDGKPVQKNRNVDKEDNDLTPDLLTGINKDAGIEILVGLFSGIDSGAFAEESDTEIEGEVVDG